MVDVIKESSHETEEFSISDYLVILSRSPFSEIRREVARHPAASEEILESLVNDNDREVRDVAIMQRLPYEWRGLDDYDLIAKLESSEAVYASDILDGLSQLSCSDVREAVARYPSVSPEVLVMLREDSDPKVQWAALSTELPVKWRNMEIPWDEDSDDISSFLVSELSSDQVNASLLMALSLSTEPACRIEVGRHPSVTPEILAMLREDRDPRVQWTALRAKLPAKWRKLQIPWYEDSDTISSFLVSELRNSKHVDDSLLEALALSVEPGFRAAVDQYRQTSDSHRTSLLEDENDSLGA
jgi:hypothetical protein